MPNFTWIPDQGAKRDVESRVLSASFGDGYTQEVPDGLNSEVETWELSFSLRSLAEVKAIDDFLGNLKGASYFTWTTPRGETKKFTCKKRSSQYGPASNNSITCTFKQDFRF